MASDSQSQTIIRKFALCSIEVAAVLFVLVTLDCMAVKLAISHWTRTAHLLDYAGKQRMLCQRITCSAMNWDDEIEPGSRGDPEGLKSALQAMTRAHGGLVDGDPVRDLEGITTQAQRELYFGEISALDSLVREFLGQATTFADAPDDELGPDHPDLNRLRELGVSKVHRKLDGAVALYKREGTAASKRVARQAMAVWVITVKGTTFHLYLPKSTEIEAAGTAPGDASKAA